ncbi:bifunctional oligoribonuclease/PAP phosphatase NrnA, partial [candidate division KSB1 bacterium]
THANPDGDAIGSSLALYHYYKLKGHTVHIVVPNDYPSFYKWMPGIDHILNFEKEADSCIAKLEKADWIFCLDYNSIFRVGEFSKYLAASDKPKMLIDHHLQPEDHFDHVMSIANTSSTSELVFEFIDSMTDKGLINKEIAACLYVGIVTDTGSFSYACNYSKTYRIIAELIEIGVDGEQIHRYVYDTFSENRMRLLGFCLSERLVVLNEYHTAYIYLMKEDLERYSFQVGDTEGVVNYALAVKDINMAVLFTEKEDYVRMSIRSKGNFSVNDFVRNHFEGGGHKNAAGGNSYLSIQETIKQFEKLLPQYRKALSHIE